MYFVSRLHLGRTLAAQMIALRGEEPIVLCLKESSLSVSIALATEVHGWVYPLLFEPIIIPGETRILGVINQDGELCYNPALSTYEREELEMDYQSVIQDASREAFSRLNQRTDEYGSLNKEALRGRTVIMCADIVRDQLEIGAANEYLKTIVTQKIVSLVGNVSTDSATALYIASDESKFMDVLPNMFDDDHYFEQPEAYSIEEQRKLAMNISQYWV